MSKILGYGEDALTLWALKNRMSNILNHFKDETSPSDCLVFYRPSFGRSGGRESAEFGEFDAILISRKNVFLIESKWDNLSPFKDERKIMGYVQELRHELFAWYLANWHKKYLNDWERFIKEHREDFLKKFKRKKETIIPSGSLLVANLESILNKLHEHCKEFSGKDSIKNVLLFFYNRKLSPIDVNKEFELIPIDYSQELIDNFIVLD
jgi:hypothetical protein